MPPKTGGCFLGEGHVTSSPETQARLYCLAHSLGVFPPRFQPALCLVPASSQRARSSLSLRLLSRPDVLLWLRHFQETGLKGKGIMLSTNVASWLIDKSVWTGSSPSETICKPISHLGRVLNVARFGVAQGWGWVYAVGRALVADLSLECAHAHSGSEPPSPC